jgi:hypothetical protein
MGYKGELDLSGLAQNPMADSCDDGKEPSGSVTTDNVLIAWTICKLTKKIAALWSRK